MSNVNVNVNVDVYDPDACEFCRQYNRYTPGTGTIFITVTSPLE